MPNLNREIKAYEATFDAFRQASAKLPNLSEVMQGLDVALVAARASQPLLENVRLQCDGLREKFRQLVTEAETPEEVLKAFENLTETKLPN